MVPEKDCQPIDDLLDVEDLRLPLIRIQDAQEGPVERGVGDEAALDSDDIVDGLIAVVSQCFNAGCAGASLGARVTRPCFAAGRCVCSSSRQGKVRQRRCCRLHREPICPRWSGPRLEAVAGQASRLG